MREPMLFYTAVPILLGGSPGTAWRLAARLHADHGVEVHWFGRGFHPLASIYTTRHPLPFPFSEVRDGCILRHLCDFEKGYRHTGGILCLIPCSDGAEAFLERTRELLEERFVLLERPNRGTDPLYGLVHSHEILERNAQNT